MSDVETKAEKANETLEVDVTKPLPPCAPFPKACSDRELTLKFMNAMSTNEEDAGLSAVLAFEARIRSNLADKK